MEGSIGGMCKLIFMKYIVLCFLLITTLTVSSQVKQKIYPLDTIIITKQINIEPFIDSSTSLITYSEVVEQEVTASDSLYARATKICNQLNGKFIEQKKNQKLSFMLQIPAYYFDSLSIKRELGNVHFIMTLFIKEGRYRYKISNLSLDHWIKNEIPFEHVVLIANILKNAHHDIISLTRDFKKRMLDPIILNEEDW